MSQEVIIGNVILKLSDETFVAERGDTRIYKQGERWFLITVAMESATGPKIKIGEATKTLRDRMLLKPDEAYSRFYDWNEVELIRKHFPEKIEE